MAKSTLKTPVAEEQNIRRRIDALTGNVKVTRAMVRGSIQPLVDKLARQAAARSENDRIVVQHTNNLARFSPGEPISVTREELDAMKAYKAALVKFAESLVTKPPVLEPGMPLLKSGSIWSFYNPPYTDRWTDGTGASANQASGTWSTQCRGTAHSYAGVCTFFTPQPGRFPVRFAPYMPHNYNYLLHVHNPPVKKYRVSKAASGGFLGTYVSFWNGRAWNEVKDVRSTLWNRSLSSTGDYFESDDTAWGAPQVEFLTFAAPTLFALWGWGGVWTSEIRGTGVESASASLSTSIPYMVIEQKI